MNAALPLNTPEVVTKNLKLNVVKGKRKARLSTNFLAALGYTHGERLQVVPTGYNKGFKVVRDMFGEHQVYQRAYKAGVRSNRPSESVIEFGGQSLMDHAFAKHIQRFHVEMRRDFIQFSPLVNKSFNIHNKFKNVKNPLNSAFVCSAGVDALCAESLGWNTELLLEYRPVEKRDLNRKNDLTEVNALSALANVSPRVILNEDLHMVDMENVERLLDEGPAIGMLHMSLGCDDFSQAKNESDKQRAIDNGDTMIDMIVPAIEMVDAVKPAVVVIENVPNFKTVAKVVRAQLTRKGYFCHEATMDARDYGGVQSRKRYHLVASIYPNFAFPNPTPRNERSIWPLIEPHLNECRDVTNNKTIRERATCKRNLPPYVTKESIHCPTWLKSQPKMVRDAVYFEHEGRVLFPSIESMKALMSIPQSFNTDLLSKDVSMEVLGQSIDYAMHHRLLESITEHLQQNVGSHTIAQYTKKAA